jgi:hypothetical protein
MREIRANDSLSRRHEPRRHGPKGLAQPMPSLSSHRQPCFAGLKSRSGVGIPSLVPLPIGPVSSPIRPTSRSRSSPKFDSRFQVFSEVRIHGVLRSSRNRS